MIQKGTRILTTTGEKPVETLTNDDILVAYDIHTGKLCDKKILFLYSAELDVNTLTYDDLTIAKTSTIVDYECNEAVMIDPEFRYCHPKYIRIVPVREDLSHDDAIVPVLQRKRNTFYSLSTFDMGTYFANGKLMSDGLIRIYRKREDCFLRSACPDELVADEQDDRVDDILKKYHVSKYVIDNSMLKYYASLLCNVRKNFGEYEEDACLEKLDILLEDAFVGERLI